MTEVVIIDSGVANLASMRRIFERHRVPLTVTREPTAAHSATHLVLPGVGSFGAGMAALRASGMDRVVHDAVVDRTPLLAVCLGMHLLCRASEESPGVPGLGIVPADCTRLPSSARVPHLGWNRVEVDGDARWLASGEAAFANSYCLREAPAGAHAAWTEHGARFVSAFERDNMLACQFHPELSGQWGHALVGRWLFGARGVAAPLPAARPGGVIRRLIPCLDVRDGRVVKGVRFQHIRDAGDPAERAAEYERQGADELVVLDIAASPDRRATQVETVRRVRAALSIPLTVGGGVRSVEDARALLSAGADKVSVNTAAVTRPELIRELADEFGTQCVVLAIDARQFPDQWRVLVVGGRELTEVDAVDWARRGVALGAGELLVTSWDRDGTREGCDVELLGALADAVSVPIIASGGVGSRAHVAAAFGAGAAAVLAASIFHDGDDTVAGIKHDLLQQGLPIRA